MKTVISSEVVGLHRDLRSAQVGEALGLAAATIQSYARRGLVPYRMTPGGQYRFNLDEVREILAPEVLETAPDLPDLYATSEPVIDELSGFRRVEPSAAAMRLARSRGQRGGRNHVVAALTARAGRREVHDFVTDSIRFVATVLPRDAES